MTTYDNIFNNEVKEVTSNEWTKSCTFGDGNLANFNLAEVLGSATLGHCKIEDMGNNMWEGKFGSKVDQQTFGVNHDKDNMVGTAGLGFK